MIDDAVKEVNQKVSSFYKKDTEDEWCVLKKELEELVRESYAHAISDVQKVLESHGGIVLDRGKLRQQISELL